MKNSAKFERIGNQNVAKGVEIKCRNKNKKINS